VCSGILCWVWGLISLTSWLFLWFLTCELVYVLFLNLVVNFIIPTVISLLLPLDKTCSQVFILISLLFVWCPVTAYSSMYRVHHVRCLFASIWKQKHCASLTLSHRTTYIYICRAVRSLKSRTTYIYIYICHNQCDEFWSNSVHS
jgi:hypothetical protein